MKGTRQQYHQRIAEVLIQPVSTTAETQPEVVAHHYTEAGLNAPAIGYWQQAGDKATQRSAHVEAIAHCSKGVAVLTTLPETPERALQELTLQRMLGVSLLSTKGFAAPEVESAYDAPVPCVNRSETLRTSARCSSAYGDFTKCEVTCRPPGKWQRNSLPWGNARTTRPSVCKAIGPWEIACSVLASSSLP